jgi:protein-S-isoprenylcysteine O-methyltransferase Ste14
MLASDSSDVYKADRIGPPLRISRHPSYTGFFYWALSTQLLLGNPISFIGFWFVLSHFFKNRIIGTSIPHICYPQRH